MSFYRFIAPQSPLLLTAQVCGGARGQPEGTIRVSVTGAAGDTSLGAAVAVTYDIRLDEAIAIFSEDKRVKLRD